MIQHVRPKLALRAYLSPLLLVRMLRSAVCVLPLMFLGCSPPQKALSFSPPTGWSVEHKQPGGLHSYSVTARRPSDGQLEFSQWPVAGKPEDISRLIQEVVSYFLDQARTSPQFKLAGEEYRLEQFAGEHCHGTYATFRMGGADTNTLQVIFMMGVDTNIWSGQFTGSPDAWKQALSVLTSVKKDG